MWPWITGTTSTTCYAYYTATTSSTSASGYCDVQYHAACAAQYYSQRNRMYNGSYGSALNTYYTDDPAAFMARQRRQQAVDLLRHTEEARTRAMELLVSHLTPAQREAFQKNKWFVVEGSRSKRRYRIHANDNVAANIEVLDGERTTLRLCGHCDIAAVPLGDHILAQKIMLEVDEDAFLRIANRHAA